MRRDVKCGACGLVRPVYICAVCGTEVEEKSDYPDDLSPERKRWYRVVEAGSGDYRRAALSHDCCSMLCVQKAVAMLGEQCIGFERVHGVVRMFGGPCNDATKPLFPKETK